MIAKYGYEKKSDCLITIDLNHNGIDIDVESKLQKLFARHIEEAVKEVLTEMKIVNAKVDVKDFGALDFVVKARMRTVIKRALSEGE